MTEHSTLSNKTSWIICAWLREQLIWSRKSAIESGRMEEKQSNVIILFPTIWDYNNCKWEWLWRTATGANFSLRSPGWMAKGVVNNVWEYNHPHGCDLQDNKVQCSTFLSMCENKINVNYTVVTEFVVQSENTDNILEVLSIIKSWTPSWDPKYFITDYSDLVSAINMCFPKTSCISVNFTGNRHGKGG